MTAIDYIKNEVTKHEANQSVKILGKSRQLLERKLDRALKQAEQMENIKQRYDNDEIDAKDYDRLLSQAVRSELSVSELTSLTKEMFNQSRLEEGKATSITESPTQAKEHLKTLLQAINDKDDHKLVEAIFTDA
ncbi:MAG TPA: hypothetical protein VFL85_01600 [Candidatus Saccharimonadales bacterium]|nr:hypothetical protein [Candidatus Saccharimonadales bacterium]